jgi:DNA-binding response OmpR family regulator
MSVALVTADLMQSSQIGGAATRIGEQLRVFGSAHALCAALAAEPARLVVVDLALPGLDVSALIAQLRALPGGAPRTLAYGSHVHVERLAAARDAGCDQVVSRGQFHAQMDQLLSA